VGDAARQPPDRFHLLSLDQLCLGVLAQIDLLLKLLERTTLAARLRIGDTLMISGNPKFAVT
jgi:hypothetical protein